MLIYSFFIQKKMLNKHPFRISFQFSFYIKSQLSCRLEYVYFTLVMIKTQLFKKWKHCAIIIWEISLAFFNQKCRWQGARYYSLVTPR